MGGVKARSRRGTPRRDKKSPFYQFARLALAPLVGEVPSAASALPSRVAAILAAQCDFYNDAARRVEILDEPHLAPPPLLPPKCKDRRDLP